MKYFAVLNFPNKRDRTVFACEYSEYFLRIME